MPSFNAMDMGPFVRMKTRANRPDLQLTSYPGVNGLAAMATGARGFTTECDFACIGSDAATLATVIGSFMAAQYNYVLGSLVDSLGTSWPNVLLVEFFPTDDVVYVPGYGWGQEFHAEFLHLTD